MEAAPAAQRDRLHVPTIGLAVLLLLAAASAGGCGTYIGTTAASFLRRVREEPDPNIRFLAYAKLGSPGCYDNEEQKLEVAKVLVEKLEKGKEPVATRAVICRTLGTLGKPVARDVILKSVNDPDAVVRVEACRALGRVGRTEDATVLARLMATDVLEDCRVAAVEAIGELKPEDPRIVRVLVDGMLQDDPAIRLASLNSLRSVTGKDLGVEPGAWLEWVNRGDAPAGASPSQTVATAPTTPVGHLPIELAPENPVGPTDSQIKPAQYPPRVPPYKLPGVDR